MNARNKKRYSNNNVYNRNRADLINAASEYTFGFDCVCLLKGVLWGWEGDPSKIYGGATYKANSVPDVNENTMIKLCSDVSTDFSNMPIGSMLWMPGHCGVYIGDGKAVECTPLWDDGVQITYVGNLTSTPKQVNKRRIWQKHGKLPWVEYEEKPMKEYTVRVNVGYQRIRSGPGTNFKHVGDIRNRGVYTIVKEDKGQGAKNWGRLKTGEGWIALDNTTKQSFSTTQGFTGIYYPEQIKKISFEPALQPLESIDNAYKRLGCHILLNANPFNMTTGATEGYVMHNGVWLSKSYNPYGYGFVKNEWPVFSYANNIKAPDFVGGFPCIVRNSQIEAGLSKSGRRGRTAIGLSDSQLVIRVIPDKYSYPRMTIHEMAQEMRRLGCTNAINLDGGGSTQIRSRMYNYVSGRLVDGFIAIWLADVEESIHYTVQSGDTLSKIAAKVNREYGINTTYQQIAKANNIRPPYIIRPGQTLIIER